MMGSSVTIEAELVSGSEQVLEIGLDSSSFEKGIQESGKQIGELLTLVVQTAGKITKAFSKGSETTQKSADNLNVSVDSATQSVESLTEIANQDFDILGHLEPIIGFMESILSIFTAEQIGNAVVKCMTVIGNAVLSILAALGIAVDLPAEAVGAITLAVIAAIAAIIVFWDEISIFLTETLPQLWEQTAKWLSENAGPVGEIFSQIMSRISTTFMDVIQLFQQIGGLIGTVVDVIKQKWQSLMQILMVVGPWIKQYVLDPIVQYIVKECSWLGEIFNGIIDMFYNCSSLLIGLWNTVLGLWGKAEALFVSYVVLPLTKLATDLANKLGKVFSGIKDNFLEAVKNILNAAINVINLRIKIPFEGVNRVIEGIRGIEIAGYKPFAGLKSINVPQIPHLARGAVLPANRPFLAVVGDQRHGTNVEAPLTTIQEAVSAVMGDHIAAMMAGFDALLREQQATRRTIESIEIGDTVIGQAAGRYINKMAVVHGG